MLHSENILSKCPIKLLKTLLTTNVIAHINYLSNGGIIFFYFLYSLQDKVRVFYYQYFIFLLSRTMIQTLLPYYNNIYSMT